MLIVAFVGYLVLLAGYPVAIRFLAARRASRRDDGGAPAGVRDCSVALVVRNEARVIDRRLRNLRRQIGVNLRQVIVVDDGSTDGTAQRVQDWARQDGRIVLLTQSGGGKSRGLQAAVAQCTAPILVFCDARQVFDVHALGRLCRAFDNPALGVAAGELRYTSERYGRARAVSSSLAYWRFERGLRRAENALGIMTGVSGAIYAIRTALCPAIPPGLLLDDIYIPLGVRETGAACAYIADAIAWDVEAPPAADDRRRLRTVAGNLQLLRFRPDFAQFWRSRSRFGFMCHKLLRLALPVFSGGLALYLLLVHPGLVLVAVVAAGVLAGIAKLTGGVAGTWRVIEYSRKFVRMNAIILRAAWAVMTRQEATLWRHDGRNGAGSQVPR